MSPRIRAGVMLQPLTLGRSIGSTALTPYHVKGINMENVLYRCVLVPAFAARDGETPTTLNVTQEVNGIAVLIDDVDTTRLLKWFLNWQRDEAIEFGVTYAQTHKLPSKPVAV